MRGLGALQHQQCTRRGRLIAWASNLSIVSLARRGHTGKLTLSSNMEEIDMQGSYGLPVCPCRPFVDGLCCECMGSCEKLEGNQPLFAKHCSQGMRNTPPNLKHRKGNLQLRARAGVRAWLVDER